MTPEEAKREAARLRAEQKDFAKRFKVVPDAKPLREVALKSVSAPVQAPGTIKSRTVSATIQGVEVEVELWVAQFEDQCAKFGSSDEAVEWLRSRQATWNRTHGKRQNARRRQAAIVADLREFVRQFEDVIDVGKLSQAITLVTDSINEPIVESAQPKE